MRSRSLPTLVGIVALAFALLLGTAQPAGADAQTAAAVAWIVGGDRQQPDGGIYVPAAFGNILFETPDAILAIAEEAQTTDTWDPAEALAAVEAIELDGDGPTPLDAIDDYLDAEVADDGVEGGPAAKLIVLVAEPLGLDPTDFDPAEDGAPVDLVAALAADPPVAGTLSSVAFAALADVLTDDGDLDARIALLRESQQANGGWGFGGDPDGTDVDVDTTAFALMALVASGVPAGDATVEGALRLLASTVPDDGVWEAFGSDSPNSTATGLLAVIAAGWDHTDGCWRTVNAPATTGRPYTDPDAGLRTLQRTTGDDAGSFATSFDVPGSIGTFATTQAVQALLRGWFPVNGTIPALQDLAELDAFSDVSDCAFYSQGVAWMAATGITTGYGDGTFRPQAGMTRQAIAAQLFRFSGQEGTFVPPAEATFPDVPTTHPFFDAIEWMVAEGITTGYGDGTFRPGTRVNRQQAAAFLHRIAGEPEVDEGAPEFPDVPDGSAFDDAISWMALHRLTNPYPDGGFHPTSGLNRGQLSTFLYRLGSTEPAWAEDATIPPTVLFPVV